MLHLLLTLSALRWAAAEWSPPVISLNSEVVGTQEKVVSVGKRLILSCEGNGNLTWSTRLAKHKKHVSKDVGNISVFNVTRSTAEYTGTYVCVYLRQPNVYSSVHIYVSDPNKLFTPSTNLWSVKKEGDDLLLPCLLTDPNATDFTLRMENGSSTPPGMNFTADPKSGILIRNLLPSYNSDYVCSARVGGKEKTSRSFSVNVIQRLRFPPYVSLESVEYVRIVGERLRLSCKTHNPNFNYNVTWKHTCSSRFLVEESVISQGSRLDIESIFTIPKVQQNDTGNITCMGVNEAGINSTTTYLKVVDKPYIRLTPQMPSHFNQKGLTIYMKEGEDLDLSVWIEAYPQITFQRWKTPSQNMSTQVQSFHNPGNNRYEAKLLLKRLTSKEQGQYIFYVSSDKANDSIVFSVQTYKKPSAVVKKTNDTTLTCTASGFPAPSIIWYQCSGIRATCTDNGTEVLKPLQMEMAVGKHQHLGTVEVESVLTVEPTSQRTTLECIASNHVGDDSVTFAMEVSQDKLLIPTLAGASSVAGVFLLLLLILLYKYKQKPRYEVRWKIIEASNGNNYTFIDPTHLPYNEKWEFPRDKLRLGKILGAGAFGKVVEATAYGLGKEDNVTRVAVKMLKPSAHSDEKEALMSELKILSHLGHHKNIVNLLGACTQSGPVLVITEYCKHGDLLNFLRDKKETFLNLVMHAPGVLDETSDYKNVCVEKKYIRSDSGISSSCSDSYLEMKPSQVKPMGSSQGSSCEDDEGDTWPLDMEDLLRFSNQVAQGLDFLAAKNCIHRDVAARNVLLADGRIAKICDFGLARDIMNDSNYVVKGNARLPVKWMAPESIFDCVYTVQSDVWSYGILLWEIFSLGKSPYPSVLVDTKFYKMIKYGYQMSRPDLASPEMYTIMKMCWNLEPTERPTFGKIVQMIERLLGDQTGQIYQNVQQDVLKEQPDESSDAPKRCEESCDQSCDQEEEELPLMKTNNYQFC